ncbi:MAG: sulfurtransferase [Alphaproteobacteria bacterium]|nr:sulfurtransferase [Alphaproteobacteria bacterium]
MSGFHLKPHDLYRLIGTPAAPRIVDVRRRAAFEADDRALPGASWLDHRETERWPLNAGEDVVAYCAHGHNVSQMACAALRARGVRAWTLSEGIEGWKAAGLPTVKRFDAPHGWITRERPKVDRIACPWFIRRFVDPRASILFVAADQVEAVAAESGAVPFDIPGVAFSHDGDDCSFDAFLKRFGVNDSALLGLAPIVRGADTGRPDLAPKCAGLLAASLGISAETDDDHDASARGFVVYDALYAWRCHALAEKHGWPPVAL